jgi:hypothetical protein
MGGITERRRSGIQHPFSQSRRTLWAIERDAGRAALWPSSNKAQWSLPRSAEEEIEGVDVKVTFEEHWPVRLADGAICEAEIHRFEAHGIGRKGYKIKRVFDE